MLVMRTTKRPAHPVGEFVRAQQSIELHDLALAMNPFRLDGVEPRSVFWRVDKAYPLSWVLKKSAPQGHRFHALEIVLSIQVHLDGAFSLATVR
jgi:hypothetical protein